VPLLLAVATATLVARVIESRSIYDARLTDEQVRERQRSRDRMPPEPQAIETAKERSSD
jgi:H+/Cl- antiporter ClcA